MGIITLLLRELRESRFFRYEQEPNYCCVVQDTFSEENEDLGKFHFPSGEVLEVIVPIFGRKKEQQEGERK